MSDFEEYYPNPDEDFERENQFWVDLRRKKLEKNSLDEERPKNWPSVSLTDQVERRDRLQAVLRKLEEWHRRRR